MCYVLILECHTLQLFRWNVFRMNRILERVKAVTHHSQYCCHLKAVLIPFRRADVRLLPQDGETGSLVSHYNWKTLGVA